jgi:hypothetical protein
LVNDVSYKIALQIYPFAFCDTGRESMGVGLISANILDIYKGDR